MSFHQKSTASGKNVSDTIDVITDDRLVDSATSELYQLMIIFEGSITIWRSKTTLDVLIVHHRYVNCFEVVVHEPIKDVESPRMYIDANVLYCTQKQNDLEKKMWEKKIYCEKWNKEYDDSSIEQEVRYQLVVSFINTRMAIITKTKSNDNNNNSNFGVYLQPKKGDCIYEQPQTDVHGSTAEGVCLSVLVSAIYIYTFYFLLIFLVFLMVIAWAISSEDT